MNAERCSKCAHHGSSNSRLCAIETCPQFEPKPKADELPEIEGWERTTVDQLKQGEEVLVLATSKKRDGPMIDMQVDHTRGKQNGCFYSTTDLPCYRRIPPKIRADEVPVGRSFLSSNRLNKWTRLEDDFRSRAWFVCHTAGGKPIIECYDSFQVTLIDDEGKDNAG